MHYTYQQLVDYINNNPNGVCFSYKTLVKTLGFTRIDGMAFLLLQLLRPHTTEEDVSYAQPMQLEEICKTFAKENDFWFFRDFDNYDRWLFKPCKKEVLPEPPVYILEPDEEDYFL